MNRIGIDIGSTTAKLVAIDEKEEVLLSRYKRHNADIKNTLLSFWEELEKQFPGQECWLKMTGSAGMGVCERYGFNFIQEVIALNFYAKNYCKDLKTIIDIGGEDAKIIFINENALPDMRMNGNCAGGTGAFIDQMAAILGMSIEEMDQAAAKAQHIHPIASRCGVFSKTDVQNLVAKNVSRADICASIFHAIAVQVVASLSRGHEIKPKILFCGGPLAFIASLRQAFKDYLNLKEEYIFQTENANMLTATGCALSIDPLKSRAYTPQELTDLVLHTPDLEKADAFALPSLFKDETELAAWRQRKARTGDLGAPLKTGDRLVLGIDSGSTTTKVVLVDGESLAKLMIEYNLGVSTQAVYQIKRLDSDFFSEDND